jgi:uncharacterized membrane protein YciS (DUF1049 family)
MEIVSGLITGFIIAGCIWVPVLLTNRRIDRLEQQIDRLRAADRGA